MLMISSPGVEHAIVRGPLGSPTFGRAQHDRIYVTDGKDSIRVNSVNGKYYTDADVLKLIFKNTSDKPILLNRTIHKLENHAKTDCSRWREIISGLVSKGLIQSTPIVDETLPDHEEVVDEQLTLSNTGRRLMARNYRNPIPIPLGLAALPINAVGWVAHFSHHPLLASAIFVTGIVTGLSPILRRHLDRKHGANN